MKRYAFWILLVLFFMPLIIYQAYLKRGYFAVGGEWLIPILVWVVVVLIRDMYQFMKEETYCKCCHEELAQPEQSKSTQSTAME